MKAPTWRSNLAVFVVIAMMVAGYFFWQQDLALRQFREQAREYSRIIATVVERNITNVLTGTKGLDNVTTRFLYNSARFVSYLNGIEKFTVPELSAFATESGLAGVKVVSADGHTGVSGPAGWLPADVSCLRSGLLKLPRNHLVVFSLKENMGKAGQSSGGCVLVGLATDQLESLQNEMSVERLLQVLSHLHGIAYVRLEPADGHNHRTTSVTSVALVRENGVVLSKAVFPMGTRQLVVALEATHFSRLQRQMRWQFALFTVFLILGGTVSTWWLFRMQRLRLAQAREFERTLARQHEEAALGRAAETIIHEMRNPLNAINMGLQRLQMEAENLDGDHQRLIVGMREAVGRSDSILSGLRQYTHAFELSPEPLILADLIAGEITLYRSLCDRQAIAIDLDLDASVVVDGDKALLGQLLENVIKNGIEAQPDGGFLKISLKPSDDCCEVIIVNAGCTLTDEDFAHVFEPYFTSKSKGTGLGLAITRKIAAAHGGQCFCRRDRTTFIFSLRLPRVKQDT